MRTEKHSIQQELQMKRCSVTAAITVITVLMPVIGGYARDAEWIETQSWEGTGTIQTNMFWVYGDKWRIRYRPRGVGVFQISVYDESGALLDMAADLQEPLYGRATRYDRGRRYLSINGSRCEWKVTVEQHLSIIEQWQLKQMRKRPHPELAKLGVWTGENGVVTESFRITDGSWRIHFRNGGEGLLQVRVYNQSDELVAVAANTSRVGEGTSWIHQSGDFKLDISAENTNYIVEVLCRQAAR